MARHYYVGANGAEPPLTELEQEKLKGAQIANDIAQTKLRKLHQDLLERREVKFVVETMAITLRQELMRLPTLVVKDLRSLRLSHEVLFAVRMSADKTVREALTKASASVRSALNPREFIAEFVGDERPSQKEIDAMERKKARANARRRVVRSCR